MIPKPLQLKKIEMKLSKRTAVFPLFTLSLLLFACHDPIESPLVGTLPLKTITTPKDNAVMVYVPAGEFLMGTTNEDMEDFKELFPLRDPVRYDNERPQRHCPCRCLLY